MTHLSLPRGGTRPRCVAVLIALAVCLMGCGTVSPAEDPVTPVPLNVLFTGNRLNYVNDLPGLLVALVDSAGLGPLSATDVSQGGFGLQDHWTFKLTNDQLAKGGWDLVVLQQGPSATEGRPSLLDYSGRYAERIRAQGGEIGLYMVWPAFNRFFDFDGVFDSYRAAADSVDGLFFPSGEAWRVAWEADSTLALYGSDAFHPSTLGTYVAGLVIYQQITGASPVGLPSALRTRRNAVYAIEPRLARQLQLAAAEANRRHALKTAGWLD